MNEADLHWIYESKDPFSTDESLRAMFKYASGKGVNSTPTAFVNAVKLDTVPITVSAWMDLLNKIYHSQYHYQGVHAHWHTHSFFLH